MGAGSPEVNGKYSFKYEEGDGMKAGCAVIRKEEGEAPGRMHVSHTVCGRLKVWTLHSDSHSDGKGLYCCKNAPCDTLPMTGWEQLGDGKAPVPTFTPFGGHADYAKVGTSS